MNKLITWNKRKKFVSHFTHSSTRPCYLFETAIFFFIYIFQRRVNLKEKLLSWHKDTYYISNSYCLLLLLKLINYFLRYMTKLMKIFQYFIKVFHLVNSFHNNNNCWQLLLITYKLIYWIIFFENVYINIVIIGILFKVHSCVVVMIILYRDYRCFFTYL